MFKFSAEAREFTPKSNVELYQVPEYQEPAASILHTASRMPDFINSQNTNVNLGSNVWTGLNPDAPTFIPNSSLTTSNTHQADVSSKCVAPTTNDPQKNLKEYVKVTSDTSGKESKIFGHHQFQPFETSMSRSSTASASYQKTPSCSSSTTAPQQKFVSQRHTQSEVSESENIIKATNAYLDMPIDQSGKCPRGILSELQEGQTLTMLQKNPHLNQTSSAFESYSEQNIEDPMQQSAFTKLSMKHDTFSTSNGPAVADQTCAQQDKRKNNAYEEHQERSYSQKGPRKIDPGRSTASKQNSYIHKRRGRAQTREQGRGGYKRYDSNTAQSRETINSTYIGQGPTWKNQRAHGNVSDYHTNSNKFGESFSDVHSKEISNQKCSEKPTSKLKSTSISMPYTEQGEKMNKDIRKSRSAHRDVYINERGSDHKSEKKNSPPLPTKSSTGSFTWADRVKQTPSNSSTKAPPAISPAKTSSSAEALSSATSDPSVSAVEDVSDKMILECEKITSSELSRATSLGPQTADNASLKINYSGAWSNSVRGSMPHSTFKSGEEPYADDYFQGLAYEDLQSYSKNNPPKDHQFQPDPMQNAAGYSQIPATFKMNMHASSPPIYNKPVYIQVGPTQGQQQPHQIQHPAGLNPYNVIPSKLSPVSSDHVPGFQFMNIHQGGNLIGRLPGSQHPVYQQKGSKVLSMQQNGLSASMPPQPLAYQTTKSCQYLQTIDQGHWSDIIQHRSDAVPSEFLCDPQESLPSVNISQAQDTKKSSGPTLSNKKGFASSNKPYQMLSSRTDQSNLTADTGQSYSTNTVPYDNLSPVKSVGPQPFSGKSPSLCRKIENAPVRKDTNTSISSGRDLSSRHTNQDSYIGEHSSAVPLSNLSALPSNKVSFGSFEETSAMSATRHSNLNADTVILHQPSPVSSTYLQHDNMPPIGQVYQCVTPQYGQALMQEEISSNTAENAYISSRGPYEMTTQTTYKVKETTNSFIPLRDQVNPLDKVDLGGIHRMSSAQRMIDHLNLSDKQNKAYIDTSLDKIVNDEPKYCPADESLTSTEIQLEGENNHKISHAPQGFTLPGLAPIANVRMNRDSQQNDMASLPLYDKSLTGHSKETKGTSEIRKEKVDSVENPDLSGDAVKTTLNVDMDPSLILLSSANRAVAYQQSSLTPLPPPLILKNSFTPEILGTSTLPNPLTAPPSAVKSSDEKNVEVTEVAGEKANKQQLKERQDVSVKEMLEQKFKNTTMTKVYTLKFILVIKLYSLISKLPNTNERKKKVETLLAEGNAGAKSIFFDETSESDPVETHCSVPGLPVDLNGLKDILEGHISSEEYNIPTAVDGPPMTQSNQSVSDSAQTVASNFVSLVPDTFKLSHPAVQMHDMYSQSYSKRYGPSSTKDSSSWTEQHSASVHEALLSGSINPLVSPNILCMDIAQFDDNVESSGLKCRLNMILNKLTLEKFDVLYDQILSAGMKTKTDMLAFMEMIFAKARLQHHFIPMYVDLCERLNKDFENMSLEGIEQTESREKKEQGKFRRLLVNAWEASFRKDLEPIDIPSDLSEDDAFEHLTSEKKKRKGNMMFIAELMKRKVIASVIVIRCVKDLFAMQKDPQLESLCVLVTHAGHFIFNSSNYKNELIEILQDIKKLITENGEKLNSRIKFLLEDLISDWMDGFIKGRTVTAKPATLDKFEPLTGPYSQSHAAVGDNSGRARHQQYHNVNSPNDGMRVMNNAYQRGGANTDEFQQMNYRRSGRTVNRNRPDPRASPHISNDLSMPALNFSIDTSSFANLSTPFLVRSPVAQPSLAGQQFHDPLSEADMNVSRFFPTGSALTSNSPLTCPTMPRESSQLKKENSISFNGANQELLVSQDMKVPEHHRASTLNLYENKTLLNSQAPATQSTFMPKNTKSSDIPWKESLTILYNQNLADTNTLESAFTVFESEHEAELPLSPLRQNIVALESFNVLTDVKTVIQPRVCDWLIEACKRKLLSPSAVETGLKQFIENFYLNTKIDTPNLKSILVDIFLPKLRDSAILNLETCEATEQLINKIDP